MVYRVVALDWERKVNGVKRAVVGLRYPSGKGESIKSATTYFFLNEPIRVATNFILAENTDKTSWVVKSCLSDEELRKYKLKDRFHDNEKYQTFEIEIPFDRKLIRRLHPEFQKGAYSSILRFKHPWFYHEAVLHENLEKAVSSKEEIDSLLFGYANKINDRRKFNGALKYISGNSQIETIDNSGRYTTFSPEFSNKTIAKKSHTSNTIVYNEELFNLREKIRNALETGNKALKQLDPLNSLSYNPKTKDFEIYLNSQSGLEVSNRKMPPEELKKERWMFYDIEKPLWKTDIFVKLMSFILKTARIS